MDLICAYKNEWLKNGQIRYGYAFWRTVQRLKVANFIFEQNRASNELKLESTSPKYFKKIRKCKSKLFTHFKEFRGEANLWANADWRK